MDFENVKISKGRFTPEVSFDLDSGVLVFSGNSFPENSENFYMPVIQQLEQILSGYRSSEIKVVFNFNYINSSSQKFLFRLFDILNKHHQLGKSVKVHWQYDKDDAEIFELGQSLNQNFNLPVDFAMNAA